MGRAATRRTGPRRPLQGWLLIHTRAAREGWAQVRGNRVASLVSIAVMAVAIGLPATLVALFESHRTLLAEWGAEPSLSAFLHKDVSLAEAELLAGRWREFNDIGSAKVIAADVAFAELRRSAGLIGDDVAGDNPLPHVIVVTPRDSGWQVDHGESLAERLSQHREVDTVVVDLEWIERLGAVSALAQRGLWVLAWILAVGTALIVGNSVRALVQGQAAEIEVLRLVGATYAYIRRPFLYSGTLHGLGAGMVAALLVEGGFLALAGPARRVASAYGSDFVLGTPPVGFILAVVVLTALIGWCGAWIGTFVSLHQRDGEILN